MPVKYMSCAFFFVIAAILTVETAAAQESGRGGSVLFSIGVSDDGVDELSLHPRDHSGYSHDGLFVVGSSAANRDWPSIHPGPADMWAGGEPHTFEILFALESPPSPGNCRLLFDLIDTHGVAPPTLAIEVNSRTFSQTLPKGAGDQTLTDPSNGREYRFVIDFPSSVLQRGRNAIMIKNISGSWFVYDSIDLETPGGVRLAEFSDTDIRSITSPQLLVEKDGRTCRILRIGIIHFSEDNDAAVYIDGARARSFELAKGLNEVEVTIPAHDTETSAAVRVDIAGKTAVEREIELLPIRKWEVYLLHHSHVDIGYTHVQTEVEALQTSHIERSIDLAEQTADYPPGSRFKWNTEVLWAVDSYLRHTGPEGRQRFFDAVRKGWIGLDALYGNELTALCGPEELMHLFDFSRRMSEEAGVIVDSAMITDVPGYTWGIVPAMAHNGVKYFSIGPNTGHRIGTIYKAWSDRPFYWVSPSGKHRVLCWIAGKGYSWFHSGLNYESIQKRLDSKAILGYLDQLAETGFPYDIVHVRYNIGSDNGPPDPQLPDIVRDWNERYVSPKLVIATTGEMFREFEKRYEDEIPSVTGDFTPYWEDGAASSALETAINRAAAERLLQAETLWSMIAPAGFPHVDFTAAWRNVLLYDEHTWGSWNSISDPENDFTQSQWAIKRQFAIDADGESRNLLDRALAGYRDDSSAVTSVLVFNTSSWPRTDIVAIPKDMNLSGDIVTSGGRTVPSQRLASGELVFVARDVPPFGASQYSFRAGRQVREGLAAADGKVLTNGVITVTVDERTGAIASLRHACIDAELVDRGNGPGLNDYRYVAGRKPDNPLTNGPVTVRVKDAGPLLVSLTVESDAPGLRKLVREIRLIDGLDRVDIIDVLDKENIYDKEGVHIAFPFNVPGGVLRMDVPWAVIRPEADQLPGANRNYFTIQRWVDVSGQRFGVTWASPDAPLIEIGSITTDPIEVGWIERLEPSTSFYSYVMNNYWETNYKAGQEGPTTFRYSIRPHDGLFDSARTARFGIESGRPLILVPVKSGTEYDKPPPVTVSPTGVIVTSLRPDGEGSGMTVRLFNTSGKPETISVAFGKRAAAIERVTPPGDSAAMESPFTMAPNEIATIRAVFRE